jgi:hypothetical protein
MMCNILNINIYKAIPIKFSEAQSINQIWYLSDVNL